MIDVLDELAVDLGTTRSIVIREALAAYVKSFHREVPYKSQLVA